MLELGVDEAKSTRIVTKWIAAHGELLVRLPLGYSLNVRGLLLAASDIRPGGGRKDQTYSLTDAQ